MKNVSVYIVVLNWNHLDDLILTLDSLLKQDYPNMKILISDNGSTDGSQDYIKNHFPNITLIENNDNLGWAAGNNVGIKYALENHADYVLLANNDLYIEDTSIITTLVNDLMSLKAKKINIIGTNVNYYNQKEKTHNSGWIMYPESEKKGKVFNKYRKDFKIELPDNYRIVDFVSGCFILFDCSVFNDIGLVDEAFFIYGEETEFSLRAWQAGYGSAINTNLTIHHKISATNKVGSPFSMYLKTRNLYYLLKKHKAHIPSYNYFMAKYYYSFIKNIIKILLYPKQFHGGQMSVLTRTCKGLIDGVINKREGKSGIKF
ncbi:MAG: glycosyltransferase family 2 protein [Bacteroidales bacterium]|nr:glycosyltransferase family 2 protein [Bacteroidales bacterium]